MNLERANKMVKRALMLSRLELFDSSFRIFEETNENLTDLFQIFDVKDKNVLTVLSSSDQLLSCYFKQDKNIDTFDKSFVTIYYYYLRKWVILYQNKKYPSYQFFCDKDMDLYYLICSIKPSNVDEAEAQYFWKTYLENHGYVTDKYLFHLAQYTQPKPYDSDLEAIKTIFDQKLSFICMNLFRPINLHKQYQVLILSNMLEYAKDNYHLENARKNIESLLSDDGIAVCTYMINQRNSSNHLNEVNILTSGGLEIDREHYTYYEPLIGQKRDLAYIYQRKREK